MSAFATWHRLSTMLQPGDVVEAFTDYENNLYQNSITIILARVSRASEVPTFQVVHPFQENNPYELNFGYGFRKIGHIELPTEAQ